MLNFGLVKKRKKKKHNTWKLRNNPQQQSFYFKTSFNLVPLLVSIAAGPAKGGRPLSLNCQEDNEILLSAAKMTSTTPLEDKFNHKFNCVIIKGYLQTWRFHLPISFWRQCQYKKEMSKEATGRPQCALYPCDICQFWLIIFKVLSVCVSCLLALPMLNFVLTDAAL